MNSGASTLSGAAILIRLLVAVLIGTAAFPTYGLADEWFCSEESSRRIGKEIHACGLGRGADEATARSVAFDAAKQEFDKLCDFSADCKNHQVALEPGRTDCTQVHGEVSCSRMVIFRIGEKTTPPETESVGPLPPGRPVAPLGASKIEKGLSKGEVLERFGAPTQVIDAATGGIVERLILRYEGQPFCAGNFCTVVVSGGHVSGFDGFRVENTRALETRSFLDLLKFW